jgi:hypothetical protein
VTAPLVVGPLQGYRCWRVDHEAGQPVLRSLYHATAWPANGPLQASCEAAARRFAAWVRQILSRGARPHAAPTWGCQCGIYACTRLDDAATIEPTPRLPSGPRGDPGTVVGVVLLWGRVIQHEGGYRAEYARPLKLLAGPPLRRGPEGRPLLEAVAERYAVELVSEMGELVRR